MGGIKLILKSTGQVMVAKLEVDYYVKIHFIFYVSDFYNSFKAPAFTRKREIEQLGGKRIVFCEEIKDLWEINNIIKTKNLLYFKSQNISNYKTVEVCIYSHSASDGPLGNVEASQYSLSSQTGDNNDKGQITLEGWGKIDFNFHPENSILAFYGCRTYSFISKLVKYVSVKYIAGHGGSSGDSKRHNVFKGNLFGPTDENLYYVSDNGEFNPQEEKLLAPIAIVTKKGDDVLEVVQYEIFTNLFIDDEGNIVGKGKVSEQVIKKENIKLWSQKYQKIVN